MDKIAVVILAAGQGTRLKIEAPKPLVPLRGKKLLDYPLGLAMTFIQDRGGRIGLVLGHKKEEVKGHLNQHYQQANLSYAIQEQQLGTAHAIECFFKDCQWAKESEYTLVLCADTPLLTLDILNTLYERCQEAGLDGVAASFVTKNPKGYGRIERAPKGFRIIEEKDANDEIKRIQEVNSGLYLIKTSYLLHRLKGIEAKNAAKEFYLTDVFTPNAAVEALCFDQEQSFLGVNTLVQLTQAAQELNRRKCEALMLSGVFMENPESCVVHDDVCVGAESSIATQVQLLGQTKIGSGVSIEPGCIVKNSSLGDDIDLLAYSYLEEAKVAPGASVGPFARLRPGTQLDQKVKVGNFVEIKKAHLKAEAKVSHLSYVGDAEIGERTNLGCGFITCNYDGANKHFTKIGADCFIGSDSQTVAPVEIGQGSFVACSTTVTRSAPDESFIISRGRQETKPGLAKKFLKRKPS